MLVWDHLAQFVTVATAEWFDVLPLFKGNLIRNFIYQDAVSSRLFTLLAFIRLGRSVHHGRDCVGPYPAGAAHQGAEEGMCFSDAFSISARSMALQAPVGVGPART